MKFSDMAAASKRPAAPSESSPPHGGIAGQNDPSSVVPEGMALTEFAMREAIKGFRRANQAEDLSEALRDRREAITNLSHGWLHAVVESGLLPADVARGLFRDLNSAASRW